MGLKYAIHRKDGNEDLHRGLMEAAGLTVAKIGKPVDLMVGYYGVTGLAEVKMPGEKLRPSQRRFLDEWPGLWAVLETEDDTREFIYTIKLAAGR